MSSSNSSLAFKKYFVDKVVFERNETFDINKGVDIEFDISSRVEFLEEKCAKVTLVLDIFKNAEIDNKPFEMSVSISGIFEVQNIKDNILIEQNTLAILFPYARAIVSTYTSSANVAPLILPPINVVKYLEDKYKNQ